MYVFAEYAWRKTVEQVRQEDLIPNIPTQPIAYGEMKEFFDRMGGDEVESDDWKGQLDNVTFRYGGRLPDGK